MVGLQIILKITTNICTFISMNIDRHEHIHTHMLAQTAFYWAFEIDLMNHYRKSSIHLHITRLIFDPYLHKHIYIHKDAHAIMYEFVCQLLFANLFCIWFSIASSFCIDEKKT